LTLLVFAALLAQAPVPPRVSFSGYVQPQYELRTTGDDTTDRTLFRRMFFTLDARPFEDWLGQFQVDAGRLVSFGERPVIKNAYIQYTGWEDRGLTLTIGNQKPPFSRTLYGSSSRRALVERSFTGDRAYGSPGRALLVKVEGSQQADRVYWALAGGSSRQAPDVNEVRIEGPAEAGTEGTNEGPIVSGRVEFHPLGATSRDQADFRRTALRVVVGAAVYGWWNDDDQAPHGEGVVDLSRVNGQEISAGLRGGGAWADIAYNRIDARALDAGVSSGLYRNGGALLHQSSVEGGYLLWRDHLEAVGMFDRLHTDAFDDDWERLSAGVNWYMHRHELKLSVMHRESYDDHGVPNARSRTTYLQMQFVF
jgi:hypothetical protein